MFKKKQRSATVVGLDLDPSHIAAAEVHVNGSVSVKKSAVAALRPGVLRDGEASDPVALAEALRELFDANVFSGVTSYGTVGLVQNTWRELKAGS